MKPESCLGHGAKWLNYTELRQWIPGACFCRLQGSSLAAHGGQLQACVPVCPGLLRPSSPGSILVEYLLCLFCPPDMFTGDPSSAFAHSSPEARPGPQLVGQSWASQVSSLGT